MRVRILTIGKDKSGDYSGLIHHYSKQLPWEISVQELLPKKPNAPVAQRQQEEAALLNKAAEGAQLRIALDERGRAFTSEAFAKELGEYQQQGIRDIAFFIGGADGLEAGLRQSCDLKIAFGPMTWPHQMVRLMLVEQLYRAHSILTNHPYHRAG